MKKYILFISILIACFFQELNAQVGIGTTSPDTSAKLEIQSSNSGMLIPRMTLNDRDTNITSPATGLLIFQTDNSPGFYYYNGASWEKMTIDSSLTDDQDWLEEGTITAPNDITDDIYTKGNVAIGKNTADYKLDILENNSAQFMALNLAKFDNTAATTYGFHNNKNSSGSGSSYGIYNTITGSGSGFQHGIYQSISNTGSSTHVGLSNYFSGAASGNQFGSYQIIANTADGDHIGFRSVLSGDGDGKHYGTFNNLTGDGIGDHMGTYNGLAGAGTGRQYGSYQKINNSENAKHYGLYTELSGSGTGEKFGSKIYINPAAGGDHYGLYSETLKTGTFAGYFLGNVAIGTTDADKYILPPADGTVGQVIQTDGVGVSTWADSPANFSMISVSIVNGGLAYQTAGSNSWQILEFDSEEFDTNGEFDVIGNTFTAANEGYYQVNAQYTTEGHDGKEELGIGIFVSGSIVAEQSFDHTGDLISATLGTRLVTRHIAKLVHLNAGDTINIRVKDKNTTLTIDKWAGKTFFTIHRVR